MTTKEESIVAEYELELGGTYPDGSRLPERSGIYCVYACVSVPRPISPWHPIGFLNRSESVSFIPDRPLYIGEAENVRSRVTTHERRQCWERKLGPGERLCFRAGQFSTGGLLSVQLESDRRDLAAALIDRFKPPCNRRSVNSTRFGTLTVRTSGSLLFDRSITVQIARSSGFLARSTWR